MALESFTKQPWEEFRIDVDFGRNMDIGEQLDIDNCFVLACKASGGTVTSSIFDMSTLALIDGTATGLTNTSLQVLVRGGDAINSPYKLTFSGVTDLTPPHKWEKDISMKIKET